MIPDAYQRIYEDSSTEKSRRNMASSNLSEVISNRFAEEAKDIFQNVSQTAIITHRDDGLPAWRLDPDGNIDIEGIPSDGVFLYIDALCSLGHRQKAREILESYRKTGGLDSRSDGLPVWDASEDRTEGFNDITSFGIFSYIKSLCLLGMKDEASNAYRAVRRTHILKCHKDGLPVGRILGNGTVPTPEFSSYSAFQHICALNSLGQDIRASEAFERVRNTNILNYREDGLPAYCIRRDGEVKYIPPHPYGMLTYINALHGFEMDDKALDIYYKMRRLNLIAKNERGTPVDFIKEDGSHWHPRLPATGVFLYMSTLMNLHDIVNRQHDKKNCENHSKKQKNSRKGGGE